MRTSAPMSGYGAREVARMLGLSVGQVRSYVRAGFLDPARGMRGALRFSFSDLVLLRAAKGLVAARIPSRRVKRALALLRAQLPEGRSLRDVHIRAEGDRIVVGDGAR
ncbi:MAG: MerR family transcriptional regulator, partial [Myxococcales bacterium]